VISAISWAFSGVVDNRGGVSAKSRNSPRREMMRRWRSTLAKLSPLNVDPERDLG
jgi:hypothetical protein